MQSRDLAPADALVSHLVRVSDSPRGKHSCSGIRLLKGQALTARHCVDEHSTFVKIAGSDAFERVLGLWISATEDLSLLQLAQPAVDGVALSPRHPDAMLVRSTLWVATERTGLVPAALSSIDAKFIRIVAPAAKLCYGDSGTALLRKTQDHFEVLGVLDVGAADCSARGINRFVRVDQIAELPQPGAPRLERDGASR